MQFRTKARAVDLLGKGQIADLPTAITELWKNGYDAYADHLKAALYKEGYNGLENSYFIISDDGKGMSGTDILDKWLVLGTDSKSRSELDIESEETLWKRPRIKAGEKGIGRLSVAYLGNPMLMLTKKLGYPVQAVYFDWRLLENYNLFLDDISIPIQEMDDIYDLKQIFPLLKNEFLINFENSIDISNKPIWEGKQLELKNNILLDTENASLENPIYDHITEFFESSQSHGTIFLTFNPINQILELSEKDEDHSVDRAFVISSLTGFTNPFKQTDINITTTFDIHKGAEIYDLLISQGESFSPSDFNLADIYIKGKFDGHGNFKGKIRIFDETIEYLDSNPRKRNKRNVYGTVPIELGYIQGEEKSSNLTESQFKAISTKVKEYGGLYIYRDNFRVLPYGRANADFLNFEQRRSKSAGRYYFSYRRMFGYLGLKRERNSLLKDKSSREGLINNAQYRAFTSDATNFFINLALEHFATHAKQSIFFDKKEELNSQFEALKADKSREKKEKIAFTRSLSRYPNLLNQHQKTYEELLILLEEKLSIINVGYSEVESILDQLQQLDIEFKSLIPKVPKRYKPTETQKNRLYKYEEKLKVYLTQVSSKRKELDGKAQDKLEIRDLKIDFAKKYNSYISSLQKAINQNKELLSNKFKELTKDYNAISKRITEELTVNKQQMIESLDSKKQIHESTQFIESRYKNLLNQAENRLFPLVDHINRLSFDINEEQVQGAYKAQYEQMKFQWEQTRDTAQLGIAVEIMDHEFNQLYAKINHQLNFLSSLVSVNSIKEFGFLQKNFKQLEDKYTLLSPLYRISGAIAKDVSGKSIYNYLIEFFGNLINEYNIQFEISESFIQHHIIIKEPVIYTVFINIINNAIYWMRNSPKRIISFDYLIDTDELIIANSGEKIPDHRLSRIFELFYSQRPNGRGIGLYLSKQSLNSTGLDVYASNDKKYNTLKGACFVISNLKKEHV